jgi:magnesium-transporting ATPase (P-type)
VEESVDFCLVGMVGIIDPPREGISNVIKKCRQCRQAFEFSW